MALLLHSERAVEHAWSSIQGSSELLPTAYLT